MSSVGAGGGREDESGEEVEEEAKRVRRGLERREEEGEGEVGVAGVVEGEKKVGGGGRGKVGVEERRRRKKAGTWRERRHGRALGDGKLCNSGNSCQWPLKIAPRPLRAHQTR